MSHCDPDRTAATLALVTNDERRPMNTRSALVALALTLGVTLLLVPAAFAKDGDVRVSGSCTGRVTSKLKLSEEDGAIEVEFEVDQNRNGVPWKVTLRRNGSVVASTTARTRPPSGSFEVRRVISGSAGTRVTATATNPSTGTCRAAARF
jgi:hypothetical protein